MKIIIVFFFFLTFIACQSQRDQDSIAYSDTTYMDVQGNQYKFLGQIPDSLRTEEQRILINKINEVSIKYISVKDNHMVLDISKSELVAKGIPERYYYMFQQSLRENNDFFDKNGITNLDSMIKSRNEAYDRFKREGTEGLIYQN